jgi:predicted membrane protein
MIISNYYDNPNVDHYVKTLCILYKIVCIYVSLLLAIVCHINHIYFGCLVKKYSSAVQERKQKRLLVLAKKKTSIKQQTTTTQSRTHPYFTARNRRRLGVWVLSQELS